MKNKVQLVMIAMLSLILLVPAIASERPVQEDSASYNELGMYTPITEKEITLRVLMPLNSGYVTDIKTNSFTKMMEETTGVKLSFEEVAAGDSFNDVRNLMISSGDYPDIIINSGYTNSDIVRYGAEGIFLPLNYYIENTMPAYTEYLNKYTTYENAIAQMTCTDGNIYSPYVGYSQAYHNHVANYKCFIYKPWLEALGMSNPTT
ncbi:MAG: extracellular solute-binding protein, partial [Clostridiales bacterium]|nr:extracellular solute-binding protein [Clostridiales bacterium]